MSCLDRNRLGVALGSVTGLAHLLWCLFVLATPSGAQTFLNWSLMLHHLNVSVRVMQFDLGNAAVLVAMSSVGGYLFGWMLGSLLGLSEAGSQ